MKIIRKLSALLISVIAATSATAKSTGSDATSADWNGFYAGGQGGYADGSLTGVLNGIYQFDLFTEGTLYGLFAGYNIQHG